MPGLSQPVCVTGSAGFIGKHLIEQLSRTDREMMILDRVSQTAGRRGACTVQADIQQVEELKAAGREWAGKPVIHLAAEAEVLTPWEMIPETFSTNLNGTWNVLHAFQPRLFVFPSTCSVYGTATVEESLPDLEAVLPVSLYGASKSMAELLLRDWAKDTRSAAVILRLGNVIGAGCRGLVPYLVRHARRHPEGNVSAELRGEGKLIRDYTPVEFVVRMFQAAAEREWEPGGTCIFNVGTGRGMSNREIADVVGNVLAEEGYQLRCNWNNPVPASEAIEIVLNCESTAEHFDVALPSHEEVLASLKESVLYHLKG